MKRIGIALILCLVLAAFGAGWYISAITQSNPYSVYTEAVITGVTRKAALGDLLYLKLASGETMSVQESICTDIVEPEVGDTLELVLVWNKDRVLKRVINTQTK